MEKPAQPRTEGFSLAGHLFAFPEAEDCSEPGQHAPDSWQMLFEAGSFMDPAVCLPVLTSCKTGYQWVVESASNLTYIMDVSLPPRFLKTRQATLSKVVTLREDSNTGLRLARHHAALDSNDAEALSNEEARVNRNKKANPHLYKFKQETSKHIQRLFIDKTMTPKDPLLPVFLPSLSNVTQPALDVPLTEKWVAILVDYLPRLDQLTVPTLSNKASADLEERRLQWSRMVFTDKNALICTARLSWLPKPSKARLQIQIKPEGAIGAAVLAEGLHWSVVKRWKKWVFEGIGLGFQIEPANDLAVQDQARSVQATLQQLTKIELPKRTLLLVKWTVTADLLSALSTVVGDWHVVIDKTCKWDDAPPASLITHRLPALAGLHIPDVSLTDDLLLLLLVYCRSLTQLSVLDVDLKSSHAHWAVERWETLSVQQAKVDTVQFKYLPHAMTTAYTVQTDSSGAVQMLMLPRVTVASREGPDQAKFHRPPGCNDKTDAPTLLSLTASPDLPPSQHGAALQAVVKHARTQPIKLQYLYLYDWTLTKGVKKALQTIATKWPDVNVTMQRTKCTRLGLEGDNNAPWPKAMKLDLVGVYQDASTAYVHGLPRPVSGLDVLPAALVQTEPKSHATLASTQSETRRDVSLWGAVVSSSAQPKQQQQKQQSVSHQACQWVMSVSQLLALKESGVEVTVKDCVLAFDLGSDEEVEVIEVEHIDINESHSEDESEVVILTGPDDESDTDVVIVEERQAAAAVAAPAAVAALPAAAAPAAAAALPAVAGPPAAAAPVGVAAAAAAVLAPVAMAGLVAVAASAAVAGLPAVPVPVPAAAPGQRVFPAWAAAFVAGYESADDDQIGVQLSKSGLAIYKLQPPRPNMTLSDQADAMRLSSNALAKFAQPDVIILDGWTLCNAVLAALPQLSARCAVVLGPNLVWPRQYTTVAAEMCRQLGAALSRVDWVVGGGCGVDYLFSLILGRRTVPGVVHIVTKDPAYVTAVRLRLRQPWVGVTNIDVQACTTVPSFPAPSRVRALTAEQRAAEKASLLERCGRVERECRTVAAALRAETDIAFVAGRAADTNRLRQQAQQATRLANEAAKVKQALVGDSAGTVDTLVVSALRLAEAERALAKLWEAVQAAESL